MMGATPPVTTTLLLVLATTTALFFDLAAARCRVRMFNGGIIQDLAADPKLNGAFEKNSDDPGKVIIKYMTKSGGKVSATTHHFYGKSGKWYRAAAKLKAKHNTPGTAASDNNGDGYYLATDDAGTTLVDDGRWTDTPAGSVINLYFISKAKAYEVEWIIGYDVDSTKNVPIYAYVNDGLLFRSGPLRYGALNAHMVVQATHPAAKTFNFEIKSLLIATATRTRLFVGKGNYQNAMVALKSYFADPWNKDGDNFKRGRTGRRRSVRHDNWIYIDVEEKDANLKAPTTRNIDIEAQAKIYVEDIAWMVAYDMTKKVVVAHQVMYHVNEVFTNGPMTPDDDKKVEGIVVFDGPDGRSISIYELSAGAAGGLDAVCVFYGLGPWEDAKAGLSRVRGRRNGGSGDGAFYWAGNVIINLTSSKLFYVRSYLNRGHKASQVMWVAVRQTTRGQKTLAHRIMQMPKKP